MLLIKDRTGSLSVSIALRATHIPGAAFLKDTIGRTRDKNERRAETTSRLGARFSKKSRESPGQGPVSRTDPVTFRALRQILKSKAVE